MYWLQETKHIEGMNHRDSYTRATYHLSSTKGGTTRMERKRGISDRERHLLLNKL